MILAVAHSMLQFHRKFSTIVQNQSALSDATAAAATGAMLTAMACCPLPTGRGPWQRPRRVTEASLSALRRYREGAQVVETRGATDPVACATILLVCFSFSLLVPTARSAPPPRAACRSIRLLCVLTAYLPTCAASCLVAAVRRCKGGDGRGERGRTIASVIYTAWLNQAVSQRASKAPRGRARAPPLGENRSTGLLLMPLVTRNQIYL